LYRQAGSGCATLVIMKLLILYRPNSEYARDVETFIHDFKQRHEGIGRRMEVIDYDTREGQAEASIYDIMAHPAILVLGDDSSMVASWSGPELPLMNEVAAYFYTSGS